MLMFSNLSFHNKYPLEYRVSQLLDNRLLSAFVHDALHQRGLSPGFELVSSWISIFALSFLSGDI